MIVTSTVRCDILEAVDVFVSNDGDDERVFLDYSRRLGMMLAIWGTSGMKFARAVKVKRSELFRARIVLDYDVRCNSYIGRLSRFEDEHVPANSSAAVAWPS